MPSCINGYTAVSPGMYRQYHAFEVLTLRSEVKSAPYCYSDCAQDDKSSVLGRTQSVETHMRMCMCMIVHVCFLFADRRGRAF